MIGDMIQTISGTYIADDESVAQKKENEKTACTRPPDVEKHFVIIIFESIKTSNF